MKENLQLFILTVLFEEIRYRDLREGNEQKRDYRETDQQADTIKTDFSISQFVYIKKGIRIIV